MHDGNEYRYLSVVGHQLKAVLWQGYHYTFAPNDLWQADYDNHHPTLPIVDRYLWQFF
ncbi:hypothetical protein D3C75_1036520 [compost metagenome]